MVELRLPDHSNPSPYDMDNLRDAIGKAQRSGARWAATTDSDTFLLIDTYAERIIPYGIKTPYRLKTAATRKSLDNPAILREVQAAWNSLLEKISATLTGREEPENAAPDEIFIEAIRVSLLDPVIAIRNDVSKFKDGDDSFKNRIVKWMVDEQGWSHQEARIEEEIERLASVSAYVFATRLLFYEALRRAQPTIEEMKIPQGKISAHATVKALFDEAKRVSGDYETVFTFDDICEFSLISETAISGWFKFVENLSNFKIEDITYDVLGRLFERLIDPHERYEWGQHYTTPDVVDLMLSLAIPDGEGVIMDPAAGGGTFLVRGYARKQVADPGKTHQQLLSELVGTDQSAFAASISTISLASRDLSLSDNYPRIRSSSFFRLRNGSPWMKLPGHATTNSGELISGGELSIPPVSAVVCNPPYIKNGNIGAERKREAIESLRDYGRTPNSLKGKYNYHLFFWYHAASFLKKNGRLVFITSGEWMDSDYGVQLQEWLLENTHVEYVMESLAETWFSEARVGTVVVSAQLRDIDKPASEFSEDTKFITFRKPLRVLYGEGSEKSDDVHRIQRVDSLRDKLSVLRLFRIGSA